MLTQFMTAEAVERETGVPKSVIQRAMRHMETLSRYADTDFFGSKVRAVRFVALQDYLTNKAAIETGVSLQEPNFEARERELGIISVCEATIRMTDADLEQLANKIVRRIGGGLLSTV